MQLKPLTASDMSTAWRINEEGLPGVGKVTVQAMHALLNFSDLPLGAFDDEALVGFVLCLPPATAYGSLNYAWFNARYERFIYVDRIAVSRSYRDQSIGSALYKAVFEHAQRHTLTVAAEVSLQPPNPGSMRFHHRHGFTEVGTLHHPNQSVAMLMRPHGTSPTT